ncbi:MAG: LysR family transcriptional regulator [Steroidobacteraceae bacterium]
MAAFAHVCEFKSFTAAARALGVPKVAVSRAIVSLERQLGTRLLIRTTRRVSLTPAGELLRPHCQRLLVEVEAVRSRFRPEAAGRRLRLIIDPGYGRLLVTPLVPRFLERYEDVELTVAVVDALPSAPGPDWDLLICNAPCGHPDLEQTSLGSPPLLLCATPAYLARHGRPRAPADLGTHTVMRPCAGATHTLRLRRGSEEQQLRLRPALQVDDPGLVHSSATAGLGIGVLPEFLCRQGLMMRKLERVLPDWSVAEPLALSAVYAREREGSAMIHQFLEFLLANMVPVLSGGGAAGA